MEAQSLLKAESNEESSNKEPEASPEVYGASQAQGEAGSEEVLEEEEASLKDGQALEDELSEGETGKAEQPAYEPKIKESELTEDVISVTFSPDGKSIACLCRIDNEDDKKLLVVLDSTNLQKLREEQEVDSIQVLPKFSPDGKKIVCVCSSQDDDDKSRVVVLETSSNVQAEYAVEFEIDEMQFTADGKGVLACSTGSLRRIDAATWKVQKVLDTDDDESPTIVCVSPDGLSMLLNTDRKTQVVEVANLVVQKELIKNEEGSRDELDAAAYSKDGKKLVVIGSGVFRVYSTNDLKLQQEVEEERSVVSVAFTHDGQHLLTVDDDSNVTIRDAESYKVLQETSLGLCFEGLDPTGRYAVEGTYLPSLRIHDVRLPTIQQEVVMTKEGDSIRSFDISPDGRSIVTCCTDKKVRLLNVAGRPVLKDQVHQAHINVICWTPDGRSLLTGSNDSVLRLLDPTSLTLQQELAHDGCVLAVAVSPDGRLILTGTYGDVRILDASNLSVLKDTLPPALRLNRDFTVMSTAVCLCVLRCLPVSN
eukprot:TRINITY_DN42146_c0_g1_i1.p1 TRINITY_DN42146_c0_g1~~TRINITY_DN42146_c0_g1_i1.p1  ORF type:complete len:536 (-),score=132.45 TRINITY_DN42146_c0_g1_i1:144-1751(-)